MRVTSLLAGLLAGLVTLPLMQDPVPKPAPTPAPETAPAVPTAPIAQSAEKPIPGRPPRHPFEGVYELRQRVVSGTPDRLPSHGYLAITQRHLFLTVVAPGPDPDLPLVRSSVRTWQTKGDLTQTTIRLGWLTDKDGGVVIEPAGTEEPRKLALVQGGIRVTQDERNWLEFERVE